jgi:hypothetical protein
MLENDKFFANINSIKTGIILYADYVIILTENIEKMHIALKICEDFGIDYEIKWNPQKTQIICFYKTRDFKEMYVKLCDQTIERVNEIKYLGLNVNEKLNYTNATFTKRE